MFAPATHLHARRGMAADDPRAISTILRKTNLANAPQRPIWPVA
jgi:hypothetical protein